MWHGLQLRLGPLLAAGRGGDAAQLHRITASDHLLQPDDVTPTAPLALLHPYLQPLRSEQYTFTRSWLQEQTRRASNSLGAPTHSAEADGPRPGPPAAAGGRRAGRRLVIV